LLVLRQEPTRGSQARRRRLQQDLFGADAGTYLDIPFTIADAMTLTEAGHLGEDVENIVLKWL
jgi:hypothetical protein